MGLKYLYCIRKLRKLNPLFTIFVIVVGLLYYEGVFKSILPTKDVTIESDYDSIKRELFKAQGRIVLLTSLLKRFQVPEEEYIEALIPKIYVITATHSRPVQKAELTRLKNVFLHVPALHWIVVEDSESPSSLVSNFLRSSKIPFTHLFKQTPTEWKLKHGDPRWYKPRGVLQRNEGIRWLRDNKHPSDNGVVYFADDDNTYSVELFEEMRSTKRVSVWPVGLVGGVMVERPSLDARGKVTGWIAGWRPDRSFAIDMSGFAVNLGLLMRNADASFSHRSQRGFLETDFLEKLVTMEDLEPKASRCTKVLVWHTMTKDPKLTDEERLKKVRQPTNNRIEV